VIFLVGTISEKSLKIVATRCHILKLKCTKFGLQRSPSPLARFKGPTSKENEGKEGGKRRESGEGEGRHSVARPLAESTRRHCCSVRLNRVLIRPWSYIVSYRIVLRGSYRVDLLKPAGSVETSARRFHLAQVRFVRTMIGHVTLT